MSDDLISGLEHRHPRKYCDCPGCQGARLGARMGKRLAKAFLKLMRDMGMEITVKKRRRKAASSTTRLPKEKS